MIKSVTALFLFSVALCGWIVLRNQTPAPEPQVTRAAPAVVPLIRPEPEPAPAAQPTPAVATTADITALIHTIAQKTEAKPDQMTSNILASIAAARGTATTTETPLDLSTLVQQALAQGQSDDYVQALLKGGVITDGAALRTEDGKVDTRALLTQIVAKAVPTTAAPSGLTTKAVTPAVRNPGGEGVEIRVVQRADKTETFRFYTVQPGDSLGYIAQLFYGDANLYPKIWDANKAIVASPDRIRKGQRLTIPSL